MKNEKTDAASETTALVQNPTQAIAIQQKRDYFIVISNEAIQNQIFDLGKNAGKSLSGTEDRVLSYLLMQIKPSWTKLEPIEFDIKTFCYVCGVSMKSTDNWYNHIKASIEKLASRVMWLKDPETGTESIYRYIYDAQMTKRSGKVRVILDKKLEPYLINLAKNYLQYSIHNTIVMKSVYGMRLYRILKSYAYNKKVLTFDIEDLKRRIDASAYKNFTNFKNKVINPALHDINTFSDLLVSVEYKKTGRTFSSVIFTIKDLSMSSIPEEKEEAWKRYQNAERALNPDQIILDEFYSDASFEAE